jgi:adenosylcobinamide-GDP ribazoletransferase
MTRDIAIAVGFLTRLPVGVRVTLTREQLSRAALWFPAVGVVVGGVMGGVHAAAGLVVDPGPATVLALLAAVLVTGAFHEDGLADAADAAGAYGDPGRRAEILHDPRVGAFGVLALVFAVALSYAALAPLDDEAFLRAAIVAHVLGRWSTLPLSLLVPPAPGAATGALVRAGAPRTLAATAFAATAAVLLGAALALAVAVAITAAAGAIARRALGGVSGDVYGAVNKVVEVGCYLALA